MSAYNKVYADSPSSDSKEAQIITKMNTIINFLKDIVGKELSKLQAGDTDRIAYQSRVMPFSYLSFGERNLLYYAWLLIANESDNEVEVGEKIYFLDEPELHLHPHAQISLIKGMRKLLSEKGQLWIATHSVTILSQLSIDEIVLIKNHSAVRPSSTTTIESVKQLMGLEANLSDLQRFVGEISEWAFSNFVIQCLRRPEAISFVSERDPQFNLIRNRINKIIQEKGELDLLDIGAGKGRIYELMREDPYLKSKINYVALEPNEYYREILAKKGVNKIFATPDELTAESFDFILLCNVLHEIQPNDWIRFFNNIQRVLRPQGDLMIVEDTLLQKGENPNAVGFLVLDCSALKLLFGTENIQSITHPDAEFKERILSVIINNKDIVPLQKENIMASLNNLKRTSFENIVKIRNEIAGLGNAFNAKAITLGRKQSYYSQMYINSIIAIRTIEMTSEETG